MKYKYIFILLTGYTTAMLGVQKPVQQQAVNLLNKLIAPHLRAIALGLNGQETPVLLPDHCQDPIRAIFIPHPIFFNSPISIQALEISNFATYISLENSVNLTANKPFFKKLWKCYEPYSLQIPDSTISLQSRLLTFQETNCPICRALVMMYIDANAVNQQYCTLLKQCPHSATPCFCTAHQLVPHRKNLEKAIADKDQLGVTQLDNQNLNMNDRLTYHPPLK